MSHDQDNSVDQQPESFDISGLVVRTQPEKAHQVAEQLELLKGVEVHAIGEEGNLVVTIEELDGEKMAVDTITKITNVPGVISTSLIYHHSEDEEQSQETQEKLQ
ncbi:MAG: chaperone NapD [Motiliproteus sp.]|nr:chaperone NapD [Motiliproteus sp.]MCW9051570.1 chaperone NapD [Motiliproteus sp.]